MPPSVAEALETRLTPYLGPHTARNAVRTFSSRALNKDAAAVTLLEAPTLVEALRPMLRTLLGEATTRQVVAELLQQVRP